MAFLCERTLLCRLLCYGSLGEAAWEGPTIITEEEFAKSTILLNPSVLVHCREPCRLVAARRLLVVVTATHVAIISLRCCICSQTDLIIMLLIAGLLSAVFSPHIASCYEDT
jgi:hypothetical protein